MKWWQIKKRDADLERELRADLDLEEEEQREDGKSPEEARYAALRAFGNPAVIRERTRAMWSWNWLESLARDLRLSLRALRRTPGFYGHRHPGNGAGHWRERRAVHRGAWGFAQALAVPGSGSPRHALRVGPS